MSVYTPFTHQLFIIHHLLAQYGGNTKLLTTLENSKQNIAD